MKQLNIRRPKAVDAARRLSRLMGVPISAAVELALVSTSKRLEAHMARGGHPATFEAELKIEVSGGEP